ncbi:unnamed protein product, partial [Ectocarpus sp. 12 AP-2014]
MKRLSENNIKASGRLLQKASLLTSRGQPFLGKARLQARALTLNNLGCLMKKWGKPRESVKFLARALRIEAKVPGGADNPAGTHVNMSAALSTIGLHREAAMHAGHAIDLASQAMMDQEASQDRHQSAAGGLLAIACFNLGVEREHLGQLDAAIASYKDARSAADEHLGPESPVAKGIEVALEKASAAAATAASYSRKRA